MASTGPWSLAEAAGPLDARGLRCPLPVLKAEKRLARMRAGETLIVLATDPIAKIDIPLFCTQNGHACETSADTDGALRFTIVRG